MKLFTNQQYQQLLKNGYEPDKNHPPVVKLVLPGTNCVWLLSEIDPDNKSIAFGLCDLGMGFPELGYVSLEELWEIKSPGFGNAVQRAALFEGIYPMSVYAAAARMRERITEEESLLNQFNAKELSCKVKPKP